MCLVAFAWRAAPGLRLVVAANRDEFHARPTRPLDWWDDAPNIAAGRDLQAGGSWLGVARGGRFAALTNFREMMQTPAGAPSRGELVADFLRGTDSPQAYTGRLDYRAYAGFSLLISDGDSLWFCSNRPKPHAAEVKPGVYALSNGELDGGWPKTNSAQARLKAIVDHAGDTPPSADALLDMMTDPTHAADADLPDTGVGRETERFLSPMFISGENYGTRATSALIWHGSHNIQLTERRYQPAGVVDGESTITV